MGWRESTKTSQNIGENCVSFQGPGPHTSAVQACKIGLHTRVCVVLGQHTSVYVDHEDKAFYGPVRCMFTAEPCWSAMHWSSRNHFKYFYVLKMFAGNHAREYPFLVFILQFVLFVIDSLTTPFFSDCRLS
jgi:hypothetical protein